MFSWSRPGLLRQRIISERGDMAHAHKLSRCGICSSGSCISLEINHRNVALCFLNQTRLRLTISSHLSIISIYLYLYILDFWLLSLWYSFQFTWSRNSCWNIFKKYKWLFLIKLSTHDLVRYQLDTLHIYMINTVLASYHHLLSSTGCISTVSYHFEHKKLRKIGYPLF